MAILWAESMDKHKTGTHHIFQRNTGWGGDSAINPGNMVASVGRFGGNAYRTTNTNLDGHIRIPLSGAGMSGSTLVFACAFHVNRDAVPSSGFHTFITCATAATGGNRHFELATTPAGGLVMLTAGAASRFYSVPNVFYHQVWHWLELKVSLLDAGSFEVRIDGANVFSGSGDFRDDTGNTSTISTLRLTGIRSVTSDFSVSYSDLIVADGSGSAPWNDFFGDLRIENRVPDADGATANWTPLSSTNVSNIDDALASYDDDTTYISSATADQINDSSHAAHSLTNQNVIHFVQASALAKNDGATNLRTRVNSGGTVAESADITLVNGSYFWANLLRLTDPNTSAAWTLTNINAAEWGVKAR